MTRPESPTHPDAPRADEARDDECGLLHPNGVFCDRPMGHVGSHAAYSDSPELCLSWGTLSVDAPRAGGETPNLLVTLETLSQWPDLRECLADLRDQWVEHADANGDCRVLIDAKRAAYLTVIVAHLTELPAALPSLLERHRDGERAEPAASPEPNISTVENGDQSSTHGGRHG